MSRKCALCDGSPRGENCRLINEPVSVRRSSACLWQGKSNHGASRPPCQLRFAIDADDTSAPRTAITANNIADDSRVWACVSCGFIYKLAPKFSDPPVARCSQCDREAPLQVMTAAEARALSGPVFTDAGTPAPAKL